MDEGRRRHPFVPATATNHPDTTCVQIETVDIDTHTNDLARRLQSEVNLTATSYSAPIAPRSPRRPQMPAPCRAPPGAEASRRARRAPLLPAADSRDALA